MVRRVRTRYVLYLSSMIFTIGLNIRNIYLYANFITVFLQELTHVIQKPRLGHGFHECVQTNASLLVLLIHTLLLVLVKQLALYDIYNGNKQVLATKG